MKNKNQGTKLKLDLNDNKIIIQITKPDKINDAKFLTPNVPKFSINDYINAKIKSNELLQAGISRNSKNISSARKLITTKEGARKKELEDVMNKQKSIQKKLNKIKKIYNFEEEEKLSTPSYTRNINIKDYNAKTFSSKNNFIHDSFDKVNKTISKFGETTTIVKCKATPKKKFLDPPSQNIQIIPNNISTRGKTSQSNQRPSKSSNKLNNYIN